MADEKEVGSLNPVETIAYKGLKQAFIGMFMVKDLLDLDNDKE